MNKFLEQLISQVLALAAFFAFPAIQYILLKKFTKKEGNPELWYLPVYGFRLVIRNELGNKVLKDIKYNVMLIKSIPPCEGCDTSTADIIELRDGEKLFLFPGTDHILLSFQLHSSTNGDILFIHTDKLGNKKMELSLNDFNRIRCDYSATVQNFFNFNIKFGKRITIDIPMLRQLFSVIQNKNVEKEFKLHDIRNVG